MKAWVDSLIGTLPAFVQRAFASFAMRFCGIGMQFAGSILIARLLGVSDFGGYVYTFTWASLIGSLLGLGFGPLAEREIPRYVAKNETGSIRGYLLAIPTVILCTGAVAGLLYQQLESHGLVVLASGWLIVTIMTMIHSTVMALSSAMGGFQRIVKSMFFETIIRQGAYLAIIPLLWWLSITITPNLLFITWIVTALPVIAAIAFFLWRDAKPPDPSTSPKPVFHWRLWFAASIPILFYGLMSRIQLDIDVLMIGLMLDEEAVGLYRAAARGAYLVSIVNVVAIQVLGPMLARALAQDESEEAKKLLALCAFLATVIGWTLCAAFWFGADLYTSLFGPDFAPAAPLLRILIIPQAVLVLFGAVEILLVMLHREKTVLWTSIGTLSVSVILNYFFIKIWGTEGAAIATAISFVFAKGVLLLIVLFTTQYNPTVFNPLVFQKLKHRWK